MPLEGNISGLWAAKQAAKGNPVTMTAATKRLRWVGGDLETVRADGMEDWSDGTLFGDAVDFANTLVGSGSPVAQAQSGVLAYIAWLAAGQEVVTGGTSAVQTITLTGAPTGGTFTLSYTVVAGPAQGTWTTAPIANTATAVQIVAALAAATGPAGVANPLSLASAVVGGGGPISTAAVTVTFGGPMANMPVPALTANPAGLTGGTTPTVTVAATTTGVGYQHVCTPADTGGFYSTWLKSVGKTVVHRSQYNDTRIASLRLEGSSASKILKLTPALMSLDPGQVVIADPTQADDGTKPLLYTEAQGTFTIDGAVYRGHSAFASTVTWGLAEFYGDMVTPQDIINTRASATLDAATILLDAQGLSRYNQQIYGTPTPAAGAKPIQVTPPNGSYSNLFSRINPYTGLISEAVKYEMPGVKWNPALTIPANPAGGPVEFPLAGAFRKVAGQPPWRLTVTTPTDSAYTA